MRIVSLPAADEDKLTFVLGIAGKNFPDAVTPPEVFLYTTDTASSITKSPVFARNKELLVEVAARVGTEITRLVSAMAS